MKTQWTFFSIIEKLFSKPYFGVVLVSFLAGCQEAYKSPLGEELTEADFKVLTAPGQSLSSPVVSSLPKASKVSLPESYLQKASLHVSQQLSLETALERMAQLLKIDLQIDQKVSSMPVYINFSATDKPFIDILENICSLAKWRYRILNHSVLVEPDRPYHKNYNVQFLNLSRSSQNTLSSVTDIFTNTLRYDEKGKPVTVNQDWNGSNTSIQMNSESDFWNEIEINLQTLLGGVKQGSADDKVLDESGPDSSSKSGGGSSSSFSIHKQAGIISVYGTSEQQYSVKQYLDLLQKSVSSQVLIEAKIIEVRLNEKFKSGIEWGRLPAVDGAEDVFTVGANYTGGKGILNKSLKKGVFQATANLNDGIYGLVKCLNFFGTTRTLSSPRLTVMNNQVAVLKVARNHVYFKMNFNRYHYGKKDSRPDIGVGSDIQTVPIGLVMSVQPAIDPLRRNVILFLRPTISRLVDTISDPSVPVAYALADHANSGTVPESKVPVIEIKEVDSVLKLNDGEVAVLGGLMETHSLSDRKGAPGLDKIPAVRNFFSSSRKDDKVTEIVILIRVKILDNAEPDPADTRLIHLYASDPRPFF